MNPLQSRKKLLVAESELNRAQFVQEWETMAEGIRSVAGHAKSFNEIASSTAVLVAALASFWRPKPAQTGSKTSWLRTVIKRASLVFTFWRAFKSAERG